MSLFTVYKSSAGSGKTYTLVKEYLKIILSQSDKTRYRNILAITFTNKAANEMKERVMENLKKLSSPKGSSDYDEGLMQDYVSSFNLKEEVIQKRALIIFTSVLHNYSDLKVSTIDKFTHKIIRAFAKDLTLAPDFDIEMDSKTLLKSAIHNVIAKVGIDDEVSNTLTNTLQNQINNEKSWNIEDNIYSFAQELIKEANEPFLNQLIDLPHNTFKETTTLIIKEKKVSEEKITQKARQIIELIKKTGLTAQDFSRGTFYKFFEDIKNKEFKRFLKEPAAIQKAIDPSIDKWFTVKNEKERGHLLDPIKEDIRNFHKELENEVSNYFTLSLISEHIYHMELIKEIYQEINLIKEENNILLISDFNKIIAGEIKDQPAPFIYEKIGERYKNIMIDEFQDTSILQWQNLLPLIDNSLAQGNENLIVGDAKQAIYRFRGGKVEQFVELPNIYEHNNDELLLERQQALNYNHNPKNLSTNYRSQKEVILFNNWFFENLKLQLPERYQEIYLGGSQEIVSSKDKGFVQVDFIKHKEVDDLNESYVEKTLEKIKISLAQNYNYKDIAVLVRDNKKSILVADYLLENGIPVITSESLVINKNSEVLFLVNFLKHIAKPNDNEAKLALVKFLSIPNNLSTTLLDHLIPKGKKNNIAFDLILEKLDKTIHEIKMMDVSVFDLTEHIIRSFKFNENANPFVLCLLDKIFDLTARSNDINYFLTWWEEHGHKVSISTPENTDAVTIMTVHKSKGLQFPIVIIPFANWKFKHASITNLEWINLPEHLNCDLSVSVIPVRPEIEKTLYKKLLQTEEETNKLDNFNLLYVALTRPELALFIISDTDIITAKKEHKTNQASYYIHNICSSSELFNPEEQLYEVGELTANNKVTTSSTNNDIELTKSISNNWREKVKISEVHKKHWNEGTYMESIAYGNMIHDTLGLMETQDDLSNAIKKLTKNGTIKTSLSNQIENEIKNLFKNKTIANWFNGEGIVKNEQDLITESGKMLRPDRVILFNDKTIIIDYKTGKHEKKHENQLLAYEDALIKMGHPNIEKYLLYTKHIEILTIN